MSMRRAAVIVLSSVWVSGLGFAQTHGERTAPSSASDNAARELFRQGNAAFDEGLYEEALKKFQSAYAAWHNPRIKLNIATTLRALGRNAPALRAYLEYSREARPNAERQAEVEAICGELLSSVATLRLAVDPGVHRVTVDGSEIDRDSAEPLYLDPGGHLVASASAGGERTLQLEVRPGEELDVAIKADVPVLDRSEPGPFAPTTSPAEGSSFALLARADIDGLGRGVAGAAGLGYTLGSHWQAAGGAFLGRTHGAWAGLELFLVESGALRPSLGLSVPVFFAGSAQVGMSAEAGVRWELSPDVFLRMRAAVVHFPGAPEGYSKTIFVPSPGLELQL